MRTTINIIEDLKSADDVIRKEFLEGDKCNALNLARAYMEDMFVKIQTMEIAMDCIREHFRK